jgi:hypothetical protein
MTMTTPSLPTRREVLAAAAVAGTASLIPAVANAVATPDGPGSASGAPHLPRGFADTFASRYVDAGELRLHAVIGGEGRCCWSTAGPRPGTNGAS